MTVGSRELVAWIDVTTAEIDNERQDACPWPFRYANLYDEAVARAYSLGDAGAIESLGEPVRSYLSTNSAVIDVSREQLRRKLAQLRAYLCGGRVARETRQSKHSHLRTWIADAYPRTEATSETLDYVQIARAYNAAFPAKGTVDARTVSDVVKYMRRKFRKSASDSGE